jgi:hypothetical protein
MQADDTELRQLHGWPHLKHPWCGLRDVPGKAYCFCYHNALAIVKKTLQSSETSLFRLESAARPAWRLRLLTQIDNGAATSTPCVYSHAVETLAACRPDAVTDARRVVVITRPVALTLAVVNLPESLRAATGIGNPLIGDRARTVDGTDSPNYFGEYPRG